MEARGNLFSYRSDDIGILHTSFIVTSDSKDADSDEYKALHDEASWKSGSMPDDIS